MQRFASKENKIKKENKGGSYGLVCTFILLYVSFRYSENWGGGKCPEEEHTTCSGGPTINCHKRGLWGEIK
jgi:hypothetical protein